MLNKAIDRIRDEMAANTENTYIQYVGEYLTEYLQNHPEAAAVFLQDEKTVKGSLKAMEEYARKNKTGNMAVVAPDIGLGIVMEYYGIGKTAKTADACGFDIGLDSLLGD